MRFTDRIKKRSSKITILFVSVGIVSSISLLACLLVKQNSRKEIEPMNHPVSGYSETITATITKIEKNRITLVPDSGFLRKKADKYGLTIYEDTKFFNQQHNQVKQSQLSAGDRIQFFFSGTIMDTIPPQLDYYHPRIIVLF